MASREAVISTVALFFTAEADTKNCWKKRRPSTDQKSREFLVDRKQLSPSFTNLYNYPRKRK